ncbi:MAG: hypothetical protein KA163_02365 [Bacteroidia bacterium]|nr:hypothetical protein [Bacteroidia bacterium]
MNIEINRPFSILKEALLPTNSFIGSEIYNGVDVEYTCIECSKKSIVRVDFISKYDILDSLFKGQNFIAKENLIKNGLALSSKKFQAHLGDFVVSNLPANYLGFKCPNCNVKYIIVFGIGESQPGKNECCVSGIWSIDI